MQRREPSALRSCLAVKLLASLGEAISPRTITRGSYRTNLPASELESPLSRHQPRGQIPPCAAPKRRQGDHLSPRTLQRLFVA